MSGPETEPPQRPTIVVEERTAAEAIAAQEAWHVQFVQDQQRMEEVRAKLFKRWEEADFPFAVEELEFNEHGHIVPTPDHMNYLVRQAISEYLRFLDEKLSSCQSEKEASQYAYDPEAYEEWRQALWADRPQARGVPGYHTRPQEPSRDSD